jgi:hypothetical protein
MTQCSKTYTTKQVSLTPQPVVFITLAAGILLVVGLQRMLL